jgi:hypothetical protein
MKYIAEYVGEIYLSKKTELSHSNTQPAHKVLRKLHYPNQKTQSCKCNQKHAVWTKFYYLRQPTN